jgi:hypothetical protein
MIPASVSPGLTSLLAGINAAYPLATASIFTLSSLQQQANEIIVAVDAALLADDTNVVAPVFMTSGALTYAAAITALVSVAQEETALAELSALAGRAAINISNAGV